MAIKKRLINRHVRYLIVKLASVHNCCIARIFSQIAIPYIKCSVGLSHWPIS